MGLAPVFKKLRCLMMCLANKVCFVRSKSLTFKQFMLVKNVGIESSPGIV